MLKATHTDHAPWTLVDFNDQKRGRLTLIRDLLDRSRHRFDQTADDPLAEILEDTVYNERKRLERDTPMEGERERLDALTDALDFTNKWSK